MGKSDNKMRIRAHVKHNDIYMTVRRYGLEKDRAVIISVRETKHRGEYDH